VAQMMEVCFPFFDFLGNQTPSHLKKTLFSSPIEAHKFLCFNLLFQLPIQTLIRDKFPSQ